MKKAVSKSAAANDGKRSFTVRINANTAAEVEKLAEVHLWSFSKTLGVLVEKAIAGKVLR